MKRIRTFLIAGFSVLGTVAMVFAASPGTASAASLRASSLHAMSVRGSSHTIKTAATPLLYGGGPIQQTSVVYVSWWGNQWNTGFSTGGYTSAQSQTYVTDFFSHVGGSSWDNIDTQYCQGVAINTINCGSSGTHVTNPPGPLAGTWVDSTALPRRVSQSSIANAAIRLMNHFGGYNANATYFVFTPSGHSMSGFGTQWCAWHDVTSSGGHNVAYAYMPYVPSVGATCGANFVNSSNNSYGNGYFDGWSIVGGHEYSEAQTDPQPATGTFGWIDSSGGENGDKCAWNANGGVSTNITLGSHFYAVQPLFSNVSLSCPTSYP